MHANPSSLDDPFDAREAWREAGYASLWQYCLSELALREGAAGRPSGRS